MTIKGDNITLKQLFFLCLYYGFTRHLPSRHMGGKALRRWCCKHIFKHCGENVNVERGAKFGTGIHICIGNNSGLGIQCHVPSNLIVGDNVMMGPNCTIIGRNHRYDRTDIPMIQQGFTAHKTTIIEDDVWIGSQVLIMPGKTIKRGSIIAAGCVLCKDFPEYSIVGGNPSRLIKSRK